MESEDELADKEKGAAILKCETGDKGYDELHSYWDK